MNSIPTTANATPIASKGQAAPDDSSGTSLPAATLTAKVVRPVRHHARYVRSFARRVRRVASRASSTLARSTAADSAAPRRSLPAVERLERRSRPATLEKGLVEEADYAPLVLAGSLTDRRRVVDVRQVPELDGLACRFGIDPVEVTLDREASAGRDQEQRRRRDPRNHFAKRLPRRGSREDARRGIHGPPVGSRLVDAVQLPIVGERLGRRAVGDHSLQVAVLGGYLEEDIGACREAQPANALRVHVGSCPQERERAGDIVRPTPTEGVRRAFALAAAARVVHEDAIAVVPEQLCMADCTGAVASAPVHDHDGGAVPRWSEPAGELEPVRGLEGDGLVCRVRRLADRLAVTVRDDDRGGEGKDDRIDDREAGDERNDAVRPTAAARRRSLAPVEERDGQAKADEHDACRGGEDAGVVACRNAVHGDVLDVQRAVDDREDAEEERDRRAKAGPKPREDSDRSKAGREGDRRGERVLIPSHARLPVQKGVIDRMQEREGSSAPEGSRLPAPLLREAHRYSQRGRSSDLRSEPRRWASRETDRLGLLDLR